MILIIVESPTKAKTLQKFLSDKFLIKSSYGHIRDLPEKRFGVDIKNNFKPKYVIPDKARGRVLELKKTVENPKIKSVTLATDKDREGESIAWHLKEVLNLGEFQGQEKNTSKTRGGRKPYQRIVFDEITKPAIEEALKNPREINLNLVNAQQARRILDRIVGYKLSPFLWRKITRGLSAGRVQSVALRLVVEREKEIENFKPREYWTITALLKKAYQRKLPSEFEAILVGKDGKTLDRFALENEEKVKEIVKELENAKFTVKEIKKKTIKRSPLPPFTTSTLQQEAWQRFRFPAKTTMRLAQNLYERGLITYHRTDSVNLSSLASAGAKKYIEQNFGKEFSQPRKFHTKSKLAQEAHEAIRPTFWNLKTQDIKIKFKITDEKMLRLYELIWKRFIASQMKEAIFENVTVDITAKNYLFRATGQTLQFEGFLKVYPLKTEEKTLPSLQKGETLKCKSLLPQQHFTQPPARYTEATLIKTLEKEGIGRPSTYAPILDTIQRRNYVKKNRKGQFQPTEIGRLVNDFLVAHFPEIVNIKFTALMEEDLDKIARGEIEWHEVLRKFYNSFEKRLNEKEKEISKKDLIQQTGQKCPKCNSPLLVRWGKYGKFLACSNYPKCNFTAPLEKNQSQIVCLKCHKGKIVEKRTKNGKLFYGCDNYPECDFALWDKPTGEVCPKCGSLIVKTKKGEIKCSNKNCSHIDRLKK